MRENIHLVEGRSRQITRRHRLKSNWYVLTSHSSCSCVIERCLQLRSSQLLLDVVGLLEQLVVRQLLVALQLLYLRQLLRQLLQVLGHLLQFKLLFSERI